VRCAQQRSIGITPYWVTHQIFVSRRAVATTASPCYKFACKKFRNFRMPDPELIVSPLSRIVDDNGEHVEVCIYRLEDTEDTDWTLEIVASDGCSTKWEEPFESAEAALAEALSAIKDEGIKSFSEERVPKSALN
jgi:hypothetical protein